MPDYDSFGKITDHFGDSGAAKDLDAIDSEFGFAGREWDNEVGLYYNRAGNGGAYWVLTNRAGGLQN